MAADSAKPDLTQWQEDLESGRDVSVTERRAFGRAQDLADQDALARAEQEYQAGRAWTQNIGDLWQADGEGGDVPWPPEGIGRVRHDLHAEYAGTSEVLPDSAIASIINSTIDGLYADTGTGALDDSQIRNATDAINRAIEDAERAAAAAARDGDAR
jgi:hypothetical protein